MLPGGTRIAAQHELSSGNVPLIRRKRYSVATSTRGGLITSTGDPPGPTESDAADSTGAGSASANAGALEARHANATADRTVRRIQIPLMTPLPLVTLNAGAYAGSSATQPGP